MPMARIATTELFHELSGPSDSPAIVFSNSIGTTLDMWDRQVAALSGRYRCLRYDTRGHGRSPTVAGQTTVADLADDLAGLLDAVGIDAAHVVGLSLGGMTAQSFGDRHAERARSLTLMATSAYLPSGWNERAALVRAEGMGAIADAVLTRWFTPAFLQNSPDRVAPMRETLLANDPEGYAACCEAIRDMDLRAGNAELRQPILIIAGQDDPATPVVMMEEIRDRIPQAELVVVPGAAHIVAVERADAVNRHLSAFLDRLSVQG